MLGPLGFAPRADCISTVVALVLAADAQPPVVLAIVALAIAVIAIIEQVPYPARHFLETE